MCYFLKLGAKVRKKRRRACKNYNFLHTPSIFLTQLYRIIFVFRGDCPFSVYCPTHLTAGLENLLRNDFRQAAGTLAVGMYAVVEHLVAVTSILGMQVYDL